MTVRSGFQRPVAWFLAPYISHLVCWTIVWAVTSLGAQARSFDQPPLVSYLTEPNHVLWTLIQSGCLLVAAFILNRKPVGLAAVVAFVVSTIILILSVEFNAGADRLSGYFYLFCGATIVTGLTSAALEKTLIRWNLLGKARP